MPREAKSESPRRRKAPPPSAARQAKAKTLKRREPDLPPAKSRRKSKPFIWLPDLTRLQEESQPSGRIGVSLPLAKMGLPHTAKVKRLQELYAAVKVNCSVWLSLADAIVAPKVFPSGPTFRRPASQCRILQTMFSELLTQQFIRSPIDQWMDVAAPLIHAIKRVVWMCRSNGYRLLLLWDMPFDLRAQKFLMRLHWEVFQTDIDYGVFVVPLSAIDDAEYHLAFNTKVIKVLNDVQMTPESASDYLTFCIKHRLDWLQSANAVSGFKSWVKAEKKRINRAVRPLIVIDTVSIAMKSSVLDKLLLRYVSLCRVSDVLVRPDSFKK